MPFPPDLTKAWGKEVGWKCMVCGRLWRAGWKLEAHHIVPTHNGGKDTRDNWILLCIECHEKAHRELAQKDTNSANIIHCRRVNKGDKWK